jgi:hypothetical protein
LSISPLTAKNVLIAMRDTQNYGKLTHTTVKRNELWLWAFHAGLKKAPPFMGPPDLCCAKSGSFAGLPDAFCIGTPLSHKAPSHESIPTPYAQ